MTSKKDIVTYCSGCHQAVLYSIPKTLPKNPRAYCNRCKKQFSVKGFINASRQSRKLPSTPPKIVVSKGKGETAPPTQNITTLQDKIKFYKTLDPDDILILGMTKQIELDAPLFNIFDKKGLYNKQKEKVSGERYIYEEPDWFYKHQQDAAELGRRGNLYLEGMRQLTGKSTLMLILCYEKMYLDEIPIYFISPSKDLSKEILGKTRSDHRVNNIYKESANALLRESVTLKNGTSLSIRACKPAAVQGLTGGIWIDEFDKILAEKETAEAFAAMMPIVITLLMKGEAFIWITGNKGVGQAGLIQEYVKTILSKYGMFFPICEIMEPDGKVHRERTLTILNDFEPKIPQDPFEREQWFIDFIFEIQKAIAGVEFAMAQMKNIRLDISGIWTKVDLLNAFNRFDPLTIPGWDHIEKTIIGVDPGVVHGTGLVIAQRCLETGHVYVIVAEKRYGTQISEDQFKRKVMDYYEKYIADEILCESNSGGLEWINHWTMAGYNAYAANFGTESTATGQVSNASSAIERHYKERILKHLLENNMISIIKNETLLREFSLYNPYENKDKGKGDIIDALLHAVFAIVGGIDFVIEIIEKSGIDVGEDAYVG